MTDMNAALRASKVSRAFPSSITVNVGSLDAAIRRIMDSTRAGRGYCFFTLNLDHLVKLQEDPEFSAAYRAADFVSADGWPVVWMMRRQGRPVERTTGADLVDPLCAAVAREGFGVYVVGPSAGSQAKALSNLCARNRGLKIVGAESPWLPDRSEQKVIEELATRIRASGASLCFLALGSQKQELLAYRLRNLCPSVGFIGIGAGLDFLSGHAVRAPAVMQRWGLEWFWRFIRQPKRLGLRYWRCGTFFTALALRSLFDRRSAAIVRGA